METQQRPSWWQVYAVTVLMLALLFAQQVVVVGENWHRIFELALLIAMYWWLARWVRRNDEAIEYEAMLRAIKQRARVEGRGRLSAVQAHYLVVQERHAQGH